MDYHCRAPFRPSVCFLTRVSEGTLGPAPWIIIAGHHSVPHCHGAFPSGRCIFGGNLLAKRCGKQLRRPPQKQRRSNSQSSSRAAFSRSRAAGRPCGQVAKSYQELEICVFLTRVSEGTWGPVDYRCRAPFRPLVPWGFPVQEVHFFAAIWWLDMAKRQPQQKQRSSNNQSSSRAAYSRSRAAGRPCGQVAKSC